MVSKNTEGAYYQREEVAAAIAMARKDKHRVVPIFIHPASPASQDVPYGLRLKNGLSARGNRGLEECAKRLRGLLSQLGGIPPPEASGKSAGEASRPPVTDEGGAGAGGAATAVGIVPIELVIDRDFDTYTQEDQEQLLAAIKHLLGMKGDVRVSKRRGSVRLKLDLTPEQAERLHEAVKRGDLRQFDVVGARKISADTANADKVMILDLLRSEGPMTAEQISRSLGIPLARTKMCLRFFKDSAVGMIRDVPGSTPRLYEAV
jgi:hypothetical protein